MKFGYVVDFVSLNVVLSILFFAWIRFYTKNWVFSLCIGILASLFMSLLLFAYFSSKSEKKSILFAKHHKLNNLKYTLLCSTDTKNIEFFTNILKSKYYVKKSRKALLLAPNTSQNEMHSTLHSIVFKYINKIECTLDDILCLLTLANSLKIQKVEILAHSYSKGISDFCKAIDNFEIKLLNFDTFFDEFEYECSPIVIFKKPSKINLSQLKNIILDKKRSKNYLLFGLLLLITSFLVPFKLYYLISGSILCIFAIIVFIIPYIQKFNKKEKNY